MTRSRMFFFCHFLSLFVAALIFIAIPAGSTRAQQTDATIGATSEVAEDSVPFPGESLPPDGNGALPPRLALVIGVSDYDATDRVRLPSLPGVARDTPRVVKALANANFHITEPRHNGGRVTRNDILEALNRFSLDVGQLKSASGKKPVVLVYFGGHGVTDGTDNILIPADFNPTYQEDVRQFGLPLEIIRQRLAALDVSLRYIILDACRNELPLSLASVSGSGPETYKPGVTRMAIDTADETIWFATLSGDVADDDNTFTRSLVDVLDRQMAEAQRQARDPRFSDEAPPPQPVANTYGDTSRVLALVANDLRRFGQTPDHAGNPLPLILYPTKANYRAERRLFEQFDAAEALSQAERRYCLGKTYLDAFFLYSYFSHAIADWNARFEKLAGGAKLPSCSDFTANRTAEADLPVKTVTGEWLSGALVPAAQRPTLGMMATLGGYASTAPLSDIVRQEIGGFSGETPLRALAVAGTDLSIYRFANAGAETLATIGRGQLLSVGDTNGAFVRVRTPDGQQGYAEQKLVNAGTSLLRVTLAYDDAGELTGTSQTALKALSDAVVYDVAIEYRASDGGGGLLYAVSAFDDLRKATFVPEEIVPLYRAADASVLPQARSVRILLTALPLDPTLRDNAFSYSGGAVSLDTAWELSQPVLASASAGAILGQGSALACASPLPSAAGKIAIVRYPSAGEAEAAESVRRVLGAIGFSTPDPIQKGTRIQKQGTRITYCAGDEALIDEAKVRLSACFGEAFRYFPTADKALCASGRIDVVVTEPALTID